MTGGPVEASDADDPRGDDDGPLGPTYSVIVPAWGLLSLAVAFAVTMAALTIVDQGGRVFALLLSALTVAVLAAPAVRRLDRWMPRGAGVALVVVGGMIAVIAVMATVAWDLDRQSRDLSAALHAAIDEIPPESSAAEAVETLELRERVDAVLDGAAARIVLGDTDPIAVAAQVGEVILIAVLGAFAITQGRGVLDGAVRHVRRASTRERIHEAVGAVITRGGSFLRRTLLASLAHGVFAGLVAALAGMPGAVTLGAWTAAVGTVPVVGGVLAWSPIVALATVSEAPWQLVALAGLAGIAGHAVVRARWVHAPLRVGPVLTLMGIGIGWSLAGLRGAIVGMLAAAAVAAVSTRDVELGEAVVDLVDDPEPQRGPAGAPTAPAAADAVSPVAPPVVAEPRPDRQLVRLRLSGRTIIAAVCLAVALWTAFHVLDLAGSFLIWLAIGSFIAVGLDRPITGLERRLRLPRVLAIAAVLGTMTAIVSLVGVLGGPSITDSAGEIVQDAPETVASLESLPLVGDFLREHDASARVEEWIRTLPDRIHGSDTVDRVLDAAGDGLVGALWTGAILLAILLDGPRLVRAAQQRIPVDARLRWTRFGRAAYRALANVAAASAFVAALNGTVVLLLALALGIPLAPVLGLWAMGWNYIPQIGGFVAAVPLVALGFGQGTTQGLIAFGVFITYQTFENHVLQPLVGSRAVRLPPLVVLSGALLAGALAGFVGALMAGPVLGVAKVAMDELRPGPRVRLEDRPPRLRGSTRRSRARRATTA